MRRREQPVMHRARLRRIRTEGWTILAGRISLAPRPRQSSQAAHEFRGRVRISRILAWLGPLVILANHCAAASSRVVSDDEIMQIIKKRCVTCHSENPTHTMFLNQPPPKDLAFDSIDEVRKAADRIMVQVMKLKRMPLGNETAMEDEERAKFDAWIIATESANR
jgi:uncharacterized membrane protein